MNRQRPGCCCFAGPAIACGVSWASSDQRYRQVPKGNGLRLPKREVVSGGQDSPELTSTDHFLVIEERRRAAEGVLWQLPGISLVAQAFLLTAGLSADAESRSQIVVGILGIAAVLGTGVVVVYQVLRATTFERWLSQAGSRPLGPDTLETELEGHSRKISVKCAFKAFCGVCGGALFAFLAADVYVLSQGVAGL